LAVNKYVQKVYNLLVEMVVVQVWKRKMVQDKETEVERGIGNLGTWVEEHLRCQKVLLHL
jgi:hypothetical protein